MVQKIEITTKTFIRFWLVSFGFGFTALFIWHSIPALIIISLSAFLAIAIRPLAKSIDNIDQNKKRASLAAVLAVFVVIGILGGIISIIGPVVVSETSRFISQVPSAIENTLQNQQEINRIGRIFGISDLQTQIYYAANNFSQSIISNLGNTVINGVGTAANIFTGVILVFVLTLLFLIQGPKIMSSFWRHLQNYQDKKAVNVWQHLVSRMTNVVAKYVTGQVIVAILDGAVVTFSVFILALIFGFSSSLAFPFGLIAFVLYLVPMFGPIISCALNSLLLFLSNPIAGGIFLIFYIIYSQIENNLIAPKIQGNAMRIPSLLILISIVIGMYMFGLVGAIVAIPIAGCIKVLIEEYPALKAVTK